MKQKQALSSSRRPQALEMSPELLLLSASKVHVALLLGCINIFVQSN